MPKQCPYTYNYIVAVCYTDHNIVLRSQTIRCTSDRTEIFCFYSSSDTGVTENAVKKRESTTAKYKQQLYTLHGAAPIDWRYYLDLDSQWHLRHLLYQCESIITQPHLCREKIVAPPERQGATGQIRHRSESYWLFNRDS